MSSLEYQVRDARLTDIERVGDLIQRADPTWTDDRISIAADLLRQLLYMPSASVMVALDGRQVEGVAILSLRPSVASRGLVGTIDMLAIEPGLAVAGPLDALLREIIRSARNKGCVAIEAVPSVEPAVQSALEQRGFAPGADRLSLSLSASRVPAG
jgi:N-acetylglutamate synthase-like GNAT family acetyltransferase